MRNLTILSLISLVWVGIGLGVALGAPGLAAAVRASTLAPESLVIAARARTQVAVTYDGAYQKLSYPGGDVENNIGVCTDLIIRAYRQLGVDLQQLVHEDMQTSFHTYPSYWGLASPDPITGHYRYHR